MTFIAKLFGLTVTDIKDTPFEPDHINGKPVLIIHNGMAYTL